MRARFLGVLVVLAGCAHRPECAAHGGPTWVQLVSPHFTVSTNLPVEAARENVATLELAHAAVKTSFREVTGIERIDVLLLRNEYEVQAVMGNELLLGAVPDDWPGPLLVLGTDEYLTTRQPRLPVINGALAFHFARYAWPRAPRWFLEGQARYLSTLTVDRDLHLAHRGQPELDLLDLARRWGVLPLAELWKWDTEGGSPGLEEHRLASSWAWAHFLHGAEVERLARFVEALERGAVPHEAWAAAFDGVDERALRDAVERAAFSADFNGGDSFAVQAVTKLTDRPMENAEVHALLSRVANATGKFELAKREAELAASVEPRHTRAVEAQVSTEQDPDRRLELARRHATAQPDDARALVLYALNLPHGEERAAALERALALTPEDPTALIELAHERLEAHRLVEASTLADQAVRLAPWSLRVMVGQATVLGARGDCKPAATTLRRAIDLSRLGPSSTQRQKLEEQLRALRSCAGDSTR